MENTKKNQKFDPLNGFFIQREENICFSIYIKLSKIIINIWKITRNKNQNSTPKMEFFTQSEENICFSIGHKLSKTGFTFVLGQLEQKLWQFEHYFA